jgi:hypothetical protein
MQTPFASSMGMFGAPLNVDMNGTPFIAGAGYMSPMQMFMQTEVGQNLGAFHNNFMAGLFNPAATLGGPGFGRPMSFNNRFAPNGFLPNGAPRPIPFGGIAHKNWGKNAFGDGLGRLPGGLGGAVPGGMGAMGHMGGGLGGAFATGGSVGSDSIPAMLSPGEFVMSKKAVSEHGMAFMHHLNQGGDVKGYANGGPVYLAGGGSAGMGGMGSMNVGIDLSAISTTITNSIRGAFSGIGSMINLDQLNKVVASFSQFTNSVNALLSRVSSMNMTHQVHVDGQINVGGVNVTAIAEAVKMQVQGLIINEINRQLGIKNQ